MITEIFQKIAAFFTGIIAFITGIFAPLSGGGQNGKKLDLNGYRLVFEDEFNGNALNTDAWFYRMEGLATGVYNSASQVAVSDGAMTITAQYRDSGEYGAGWYSGMLALNQRYCRGYFEIRCKCAPGGGFWSAFWLQGDGSYEHDISRGGVGAAEIDIMEANQYSELTSAKKNSVTSNIHCNGGDDDPDHIDSKRLGTFRGNDIYNSFNTYGLEWTEDEYVFYVNGVETARTSFSKGVSQVPEQVIVSLEVPANVTHAKDFTTSMTVDYVRIYQLP